MNSFCLTLKFRRSQTAWAILVHPFQPKVNGKRMGQGAVKTRHRDQVDPTAVLVGVVKVGKLDKADLRQREPVGTEH